MQRCQDSFNTTFSSYETIYDCHAELESKSLWKRVQVNDLNVVALDKSSPLYGSPGAFAVGTSNEAVEDTAEHLGLALRVDGELYPIRETAYKTLLDRAKINGTSLPKLKRDILAQTLNACMEISGSDALVLIRDEKVSAVHSGDEVDYSVISIDKLLAALKKELDVRFPGNEFVSGYSDHAITSALWRMPKQKTEMMDAYIKTLEANGQKALADKLMPGVRFITSDTGVSSAKVSAMFLGGQYPIAIGGCIDEITDNRVITIIDDEHYQRERDNFEFTDEKLEKAFLKLHSKKRRVLILFFCLGKTEAEISKELGCPIRYVYDLKYHALKRLRELLNE